MKRHFLLVVLAVAVSGGLCAESLRLGIVGTTDVGNVVATSAPAEVSAEYSRGMGGIYWEVLSGRFGFGMTYLADADRVATDHWYLDWNGSVDFRYHFFRRFIFDPFMEAGFGGAGRVDIRSYPAAGCDDVTVTGRLSALSVYGKVGGGVALRLRPFHLGMKAMYRLSNEPVLPSGYPAFALTRYSVSFFGGLSF